MHERNVVQVDNGAVGFLHRKVVDPVEQRWAGIQRDVPVELADLGVAGRKNEILGRDGVDHVVGGDAVRLHGLLVEIDLGLQDFAAVGRRNRGAGDGRELRPDEILPEIEQFHFRQLLARQRQLQDGNRGGVVAQHIGRCDAGGQKLEHGLRSGRDLCQRGRDIDALLKEDFDDAVAGQRLRFDMFDVADLCGQRPFIVINDTARHIVGQQAVIGPDDADHRYIDIGKDVSRCSYGGEAAENRDQEGQNHKGIRSP